MKMKRLLLPFFLLTTLISIAQIRLVEDILPGVEQSNPFQFLEHDGFLFFIGQSTGGPAIFMMDTNETISIAWQEGFNAYDMVVYNNDLYFNANNQLHRLNRPYGTGSGSTVVDSSISMWGSAFVYNGELYFGGEVNQADPLNPNHELMAYNGSIVRLVEEVSSISLDPSQFVLHLGELYFVGKEMDMVNGQPSIIDAIYKSNGIVVEQVTSFLNTSVSYLTSLGDNLYFLYRNGDFNQPYNLWYNNTNGPGGFGVELNFAFGLTVFENKLFFFDQDNTQLVSRDIMGNEEIIPIAAGLEYPLGGFPLQNQNYLAFSGFTNAFGSELYIYEAGGEINFTEDYNSGSNSFTPVYGSFFNGSLYVTGSDGSGIGRELHVYNPNGCTETVNIPDANFEAYLENILNVGDGILGNGLVCKEKVEVLTTLNLSGSIPIVNFPPGLGITNLSGIEHFSALEVLRVEGNNIASMDLSQNTNLRELRAWRCNIQTLNVSGLTNLQTVGLNFNSIATADFSTCPAIQELDITDNDLTAIQLGTTANLLKFTISNNPNLTSLDISGADTNLTTFNATGNTALTCIQVSNVANAENQANWLKDANTSYSTNCNLQPFTVTASIPGATGNPLAIEITEGNSFTLNFESGPTAPDGTPYTPIIEFTSNNNNSPTEDFTFNGNATLPTTPFTVSSANPDGGITILAINDGVTEGDETYTITISSPDPSLFSIEGPTSFEVTIKDNISSEPPSLTLDTKVLGATTLGYDLEGEFPVELFEVVEGSSLEITLNDISSEGANGFPFSLPWSVSGITEDNVQLVDGDGNNLPFDNQELNFTVDTSNEFEIQINITLDDNEIFESNKEFTIQFKENGFDESLISIQNASNPSAPYRMRFTIVENDIEGRIITSLTNIGGRENSGIADKFEIALKYPDETYYKNNTGADIIIPIDFDNTDNQLANPIDFNDISPNPLPQSFIIKPNDSTAIIELTYLEEIDVNDLEPNYFNLILLPVTSPLDLVHPQDTFLIKVLDENSPFDIITDFIGNVQRRDFGGEDCCYFFQVEEGEDILFSFDAEKGVQDALPYLLNIEILNAEFSSNTSTRANYGDGSFTLNTNTLENIPRSVKIDQIDNFLNMRVEQGDYSSPKSFRITFSPPDNSNYEYVGPKDRDSSNETVSFDFEIIDAIPASIEATKATMNEEDPSDFVEVKIKLNTLEITNQEDISFSFILTKNSTATFGVDYRIESNNDFEIFEENISTKSKKGVIYLDSNSSPTEAVFRIIPINEPVGEEEPEGTETVIIELLDGFGYSIDNGNSFVEIDITDEDVGDYDVNLSVPNETLYEDSTRSPNSGVFEIQLFSNGNSASAAEDIKVYFEITNELDFAIEGDDYRIYDGNGPGKRDITNDLNKYVTIKKSESIGYIYVEVVTDDGEIEPNETVTINLKTGIGYNLNPENYTLSGSVNIISKEQNTENLNPSDLSAFVYSATCPEVSEGKIAMVNNSPFDFNVELFNNSQEVGSADLQNGIVTPLVLFEKLEAGNYTVKLQAKGRDDIYPPSFNLTIRENLNSTQLLSSMVNSEKKEASLKVSGSKFYEVIINDKSYNHRFENDGPQEFNLPLQIGKNSIQIRGEIQCQGIIDHEIIFNEFKFFPNPTESIIHLDGLSSTNNLKLIFYDTTGKVVATFERLNQKSSNWVVNVESLSNGTYFCKIISEDKVINTLKLIKN